MAKASCKMVYKGFYDLGPESFNNMFNLYVPERSLRSCDELRIEPRKCYTTFGQKSLAVRGSNYWNLLPVQLKGSESPESFKKGIKSYQGFG